MNKQQRILILISLGVTALFAHAANYDYRSGTQHYRGQPKRPSGALIWWSWIHNEGKPRPEPNSTPRLSTEEIINGLHAAWSSPKQKMRDPQRPQYQRPVPESGVRTIGADPRHYKPIERKYSPAAERDAEREQQAMNAQALQAVERLVSVDPSLESRAVELGVVFGADAHRVKDNMKAAEQLMREQRLADLDLVRMSPSLTAQVHYPGFVEQSWDDWEPSKGDAVTWSMQIKGTGPDAHYWGLALPIALIVFGAFLSSGWRASRETNSEHPSNTAASPDHDLSQLTDDERSKIIIAATLGKENPVDSVEAKELYEQSTPTPLTNEEMRKVVIAATLGKPNPIDSIEARMLYDQAANDAGD